RARQRPVVAEVAREAAGVDARDAGDPVADEVRGEVPLGPPAAVAAGGLPHDHPGAVRHVRLVVLGVHPVVADVGVREGDHLARVGRVGDHLLVAGEHRVEHELTGRDAAGGLGAERLALEGRPVGQHDRRVGGAHLCASPSATTDSPNSNVCRTRPRTSRPTYGTLRLRDAPPLSSIVQRSCGSITHRLAVAPGAIGPPWWVSPAIAAGCQDIRAITSASVMPVPPSTSWVNASASAYSSPSIPGGAWSKGRSFSSGGCGAWSVAIASIVPSARPAEIAATSSSERSGGCTL